MFRYLGRFGILAVCLFAIVIVMGGCNGDEDDPPPIVVPPTEETKEKTFKEQLVGSSWRMVANTDGVSVNAAAQATADGMAGGPGLFNGTATQNSVRFDNAGKVTIILGFKISDRAAPADALEMIFTLKGPYFISEDSATITLAITEAAVEVKIQNEDFDLPPEVQQEIADQFLGEVAENSPAAINGDQLRIGQMLLER